MKQRSRYIPLWHSLPGTIVAYQPIGAPWTMAARWNIAKYMTNTSKYPAALGIVPGWSSSRGWIFNGTSYLKTGVIQTSQNWTAVCRYYNPTVDKYVFGAYQTVPTLRQRDICPHVCWN